MEKRSIKNILINNWYLGIAPVVVGAILLCVYCIHGVYPFGDRNISYYDMAQSYVPLYYHTWDVLHGIKSAFFEWNVGMGCSITDVAGAFIFFPSNLFFLFVSRENIIFSMSVFLLLKMMFSAFSMSFYASKVCSSKLLSTYAGIGYACCGYILQYYTNIYYLDIVMIFPLLVWAMERLLESGRKLAYIILLSLCFLANQQLAFTIVIYVVLKGFLKVQLLQKEQQGRAVLELVLCSIAGFMIAAFTFIPSFMVMSQSARFGDATAVGPIELFMSFECDFVPQKHFMLYGTEAGIGCLLYLLFKKDGAKKHFNEIVMVILLGLPIVLENINLLWHGGSYQHFPMRFGYMLTFEILVLICKTIDEKKEQEIKEDRNIILLLVAGALIVLLSIMLWFLCSQFRLHAIRELSAYKGYGFVILVAMVIGIIVSLINNKRLAGILLLITVVVQGTMGTYGLIAPEGSYSIECGDQFVHISEKVFENIEQADATNRIKDRNIDMNSNYGFILRQSSMGCWMNGIGPNLQNAMYKMGYTINYTRVLDGCGSAFTDALLGVRRLYSRRDVDGSLYNSGASVGDGQIYNCSYTMPFGVLMDGEPQGTGFDYQNNLFERVTGNADLFDEVDLESIAQKNIYDETGGVYLYECNIPVDEKSVLYIYGDRSADIYNKYAFAVNGQQMALDAEGTSGNVMYATFFLNGFLEAGSYENENVDFIVITELEDLKDIHVGLLNLNALERGISAVNEKVKSSSAVEHGKLGMDIELKESGNLFIPIGYSDCYRLTVDGSRHEYFPILENAFVGINIDAGKHRIEVEYVPKGLKMAIGMSLTGILMTVLLLLYKSDKMGDFGNKFWTLAYKVVFGAMMLVLYVIPVIAAFVMGIYQLTHIGN